MKSHGPVACLSAALVAAVLSGCYSSPQVQLAERAKARDAEKPKWFYAKEPGPTDADAPAEFTTTESGLQYRLLRKNPGRKKPLAQDRVMVQYRGTLEDGTVFDESYGKKAAEFGASEVIRGWTEALLMMREGEMMEVIIPGDLAYGPRGSGNRIPPNATLRFIIELHAVRWGD
jgi:FKBP-type peptidyl-prolyl cis-trans isomerase